ncbi:MAG: hypothetical protein BECKG1743D_GA0114223_105343 [Candidatus Kentron sp. G]|nr:MAG: hypothetical protein BECKG1743F_GA0114225_104792 [Candidatus Kentron sp. G]VFN03973.1 MAG: hypothetical protein BECKG1743D_GA0114223_105343 [Candidatus Kentron sp. G]VFN07215.1 MAG: hypothetical protein BECKG1743E_GA0114224_111581 [Candidatus Kentron sp. G]
MTNARPLRVYSDQSLCPDNAYVALLQAVWGAVPEDPEDPKSGRFDTFLENGGTLFQAADIQTCDYGVLPFDYGFVIEGKLPLATAESFLARLHEYGKKTIVFCWHDRDPALDDDRIILFQTAFERRRKQADTHVLPIFIEDLVARYSDGILPVRE